MEKTITTTDKILRELDLILDIYKVQFSKYNPNRRIHTVFDEKQIPIDGRLMNSIDICSEIELFNIQSYKEELTHRYESAQNTTLLKNQLCKIREKAIQVRDFYNQNFTINCEIVANFLNQSDILENDVEAHHNFLKSHDVLIVVYDCILISGVYYGCEFARLDFVPLPERYEFWYFGRNRSFVDVCQSLIDFANDIYPVDKANEKEEEDITNLPEKENTDVAIKLFEKATAEASLNVLSISQLNVLFDELKDCFNPYNKEYFIYAFDGGNKPIGYNGLLKTRKLTDAQFIYLISAFFTNGVTNWRAAKELSIKNPEQKKNNYTINNTGKPQNYEIIDTIIQKVKDA